MPQQLDTKVDGCVDDAHEVVIEDKKMFRKTKATFPLALSVLFRKSGKDEPITREEILQKVKMEGE
eukprot:9573971-Ditylum_brightwellii.AAC.1